MWNEKSQPTEKNASYGVSSDEVYPSGKWKDVGERNAAENKETEKNASYGMSSDKAYPGRGLMWSDVGGKNTAENKETEKNASYGMSSDKVYPGRGFMWSDVGGKNTAENKETEKNASYGMSSDKVCPGRGFMWSDVGGRNSPENKEIKKNASFEASSEVCPKLNTLPKESKYLEKNFPESKFIEEIFSEKELKEIMKNKPAEKNEKKEVRDKMFPPAMYPVESPQYSFKRSRREDLQPEKPRVIQPMFHDWPKGLIYPSFQSAIRRQENMDFEIPEDLRKWHANVMTCTSEWRLDLAIRMCKHKLLDLESEHNNLGIATVLNVLASICGNQRRYKEAFELLTRAQRIIKADSRLGESHPCMAFTLNNAARLGEKLVTKMENDISKPYKLCDLEREKRKGVVATSLEDLLSKIPDKLDFPTDNTSITIVLESDGTEVDDEEYFATLEPDTSLMALRGPERWCPNVPKCHISLDQTDDVGMEDKDGKHVASLVGRLQHNLCHISLLGGQDLELLSDMDPDSLADIVSEKDNKIFLEQLKEASGRILLEKRQAHDAMELLKLYHQSVSNGTDELSAVKQERV